MNKIDGEQNFSIIMSSYKVKNKNFQSIWIKGNTRLAVSLYKFMQIGNSIKWEVYLKICCSFAPSRELESSRLILPHAPHLPLRLIALTIAADVLWVKTRRRPIRKRLF
jgi:hypothetical protein